MTDSNEFNSLSIIDNIESILHTSPLNLTELRQISRKPGGFQTNHLRQRVWPKLLNINRYNHSNNVLIGDLIDQTNDETLQIKCDIERSLYSLDVTIQWEDVRRNQRRQVLTDIIVALLSRNRPNLYYYQGLHDIVSIVMLVAEDDYLAFEMTEKICLNYLSDCLKKDFQDVACIMDLLWPLIEYEDEEFFGYMKNSGVEPYFITSWLITWFSHDIKDFKLVTRVFDALICSHPSYILYLCASFRDDIVNVNCDFASVHSFISKLIDSHSIPFDSLIISADDLIRRHPPDRLSGHGDRRFRDQIKNNRICMLRRVEMKEYALTDWEELLVSESVSGSNKKPNLSKKKKELSITMNLKSTINRILKQTVKRVFNNRAVVWTIIGISGGVVSYGAWMYYYQWNYNS